MKKGEKVLTTITLVLYEGGKCTFTGASPGDFDTQEEFIAAINALMGFCWRVCVYPGETIPGSELFEVKRVAWTKVGGMQAPALVVGGIKLEGGHRG
jgi:hypothetical protein